MSPTSETAELLSRVTNSLRSNKVHDFVKLNKKLTEEQSSNVLLTICESTGVNEETRCQFASVLLYKHNAFRYEGKYALHAAANLGYDKLVYVLLNHPVHPADAKVTNGEEQTAVHCAVQGAAEKEEKALRCIKLLYEKRCNLNAKDGNGATAIHLAAAKKLWLVVSFLLDKIVKIDEKVGNVSARDIIREDEKRSHWVESIVEDESNNFKFQISCDGPKSARKPESAKKMDYVDFEQGFKDKALQENSKQSLEEYIATETWDELYLCSLLAFCVDETLINGVQVLVDRCNVDVTKVVDKMNNQTILHKAVICKNPNVEIVRYILRSAKVSEEKFASWIEATDKVKWKGECRAGCTALQYAAWQRLDDLSQVLLEFGASIFSENVLTGKHTFLYLRPQLIEMHLDQQLQLSDKPLTDNDYALTFDFNFLKTTQPAHYTRQGEYSEIPMQETSDEDSLEMGALRMLADSPDHAKLLLHPVVRAFLCLKWYRLCWFYWLNFIFYFVFTISVCVFVQNSSIKDGQGNKSTSDQFTYEKDISFVFLMIMTCLLALREIFQMVMYRCSYLAQLENFLEMIIIFLTFLLFGLPFKALAATIVLLVFIEFALMIGRHPKLAVYVHMFLLVACTFLKCLLWYFSLIVAFGISFYIIFPLCESGKDCKKSFDTVGQSIFKTIVMISGEYEAGEIDFDFIPIASHIIFVAFIFFISIVMVNLLNGLAVSDTQIIRNEAQLISNKYQARMYSDFESCLLVVTSKMSQESRRTLFNRFKLLDELLVQRRQADSDDEVDHLRGISSALGICQPLLACFSCRGGEQQVESLRPEISRNRVSVLLNDKQRHAIPDIRYWAPCCLLRVLPLRVTRACSTFRVIVDDALHIANAKSRGRIQETYKNLQMRYFEDSATLPTAPSRNEDIGCSSAK